MEFYLFIVQLLLILYGSLNKIITIIKNNYY